MTSSSSCGSGTSFEVFLSRAIESTKLFIKIIDKLHTFATNLKETYRITRKKQDIEVLESFKIQVRTIVWKEIMGWFSMIHVGGDNLYQYPAIGASFTSHTLRILLELFDFKSKEQKPGTENKEQKFGEESLSEIMYHFKKHLDQLFPQLLVIHGKKFKKENDQLKTLALSILNDMDEIFRIQKESIINICPSMDNIDKTQKMQEQLLEMHQIGKSGIQASNQFVSILLDLHTPEISSCILS